MSRILAASAVLVVLLGAGEAALADGYVRIYNPTDFRDQTSWNGGEFTLQRQSGNVGVYSTSPVANPSYSNSFETFCLETSEYFSFSSATKSYTYYGVISDNAVSGGGGSSRYMNSNGVAFLKDGNLLFADELSDKTKALYYLFRTGQLEGFSYAAGSARQDDSKALQQAIWGAENEAGGSTTNEWATYFSSQAAIDAVTGRNMVRVLTLWSAAPTYVDEDWEYYDSVGKVTYSGHGYYDVSGLNFVQDQLTLVPLPTALLAGFGLLGGAGLVRQIRRRRNRLL